MTLLYAHRGSWGESPQNTPAAMRRARELGADGVEFDVRMTIDHNLVVCHDELLGDLEIASSRLVDLTESDSWPRGAIAHLDEVIDASDGLLLNVEIKPDPKGRVAEMVRATLSRLSELLEATVESRVLISSFDPAIVSEVGRHRPSMERYLLLDRLGSFRKGLTEAVDSGASGVNLERFRATAQSIAALRSAGLGVGVWTVDSVVQARALSALAVDAIISNRVEKLVPAVRLKADLPDE